MIAVAGALVAGSFTAPSADAATYTWTPVTAGPFAWNVNANWTPSGFPNLMDDIAILSVADLTANQTINMTAAITIGELRIGDALANSTYTLAAGGGSLTFDVTSGSALLLKNHGGADVISTGVTLNDNLIVNHSIAGQTLEISGPITGTGQNLTKEGAGTLVLSGNNNLLTGAITVNAGTLQGRTNANSLGVAGTDVTLNAGTILELRGDTGINFASDVILGGNATINTAPVGTGNATHTIATLLLKNNTATVTNANDYNLTVSGVTTLAGAVSTINNVNTNGTLDITLAGQVTGAGALNRVGPGPITLSSSLNDYSGGTNLLSAGPLIVGALAKLGSGAVYVAPGGILRISDTGALTGPSQISVQSGLTAANIGISQGTLAPLTATTTSVGYGFLEYNNDFAIGTDANAVKASVFGAVLRSNFATIATNIDMGSVGSSTPGNGKWFLGTATTATFSGLLTPAGDGYYRLGANNAAGTVMTISTADALSGATNNVIIGSPINNVISAFAGGTGTVAISNANSGLGSTFGTVTVNRGSTLNLTGTANTTQNPIGGSNVTVAVVGGTLGVSGNYAGLAPQLGNTTFNITGAANAYARGAFTLDNSAVTAATPDLRLDPTSSVNLAGASLTYTASNAAVASDQTVASTSYEGANLITVGKGTANTSGIFTITSATRSRGGTLELTSNSANILGAAATQALKFGTAPAMTNTMVGGNIVIRNASSATDVRFATYGANGFTPRAFDASVSTAATISVSQPTQVVDVTGAAATAYALTGNASWQAMRVGDVTLTGNTVTLGSSAGNTVGGLIFGASTAGRLHTSNFTFGGTAASRIEAAVYTTSAQLSTMGGVTTANGFTKFGTGSVRLGQNAAGTNGDDGTGVGFTPGSTISVNEGALSPEFAIGTGNINGSFGLRAVGTTLNNTLLRMAGGTVGDGGGNFNANLLNDTTVVQDSTFVSNAANSPRFGSLTFAARQGGIVDPIVLHVTTGGLVFGSTIGATRLNGAVVSAPITGDTTFTGAGIINNTVAASNTLLSANFVTLEGALKGSGNFTKYGIGTVLVTNPGGTYTGNITVNQGVLASSAGATTATPFGTTGTLTVNAGGAVRLANAANVPSGGLTVNSDLTGLGIVALAYNGALPAITYNNGNNGSPFAGVIAIDASGFNQAIDQSASATFLGSVGGANGASGVAQFNSANFTGTITPGASTAISSGFSVAPSGSTYRLGGGTGTLNMNGLNQLTGTGNNVVFGALSNTHQGNSVALLGGGGTVAMNQPNNYTGFTTFNQGQTVQIADNGAFGTSTLIFNGGTIQGDSFNRTNGFAQGHRITNAVKFAGDVTFNSNFNGPADLTFVGDIGLSNSATGGSTRTINVGTATYAQLGGSIITISGKISDGDSPYNGFNKAGAGTLRLTSTSNDYTGITTITAGNLAITDTLQLGANPYVNMNGGALSAWEQDFILNKTLNFVATSNVDVGEGRILTQDPSSTWQGTGSLQKIGAGTLILKGDNSFAGLTVMSGVVNASANNQLGNTATPGAIVFNNASPNYGTGGTPMLRFTDDVANVNRVITMTTVGAISVESGKSVIVSAATGNAGGVLNKVGAGTLILGNTAVASTNAHDNTAANAGTLQSSATSGTPFGDVAVTLNGGTIRMNSLADSAITMGTTGLNFAGGGIIRLDQAGAFQSQMTSASIVRTTQGTMVLSGTNWGGTTGARSRLIATTNLLGAAVASSNFLSSTLGS